MERGQKKATVKATAPRKKHVIRRQFNDNYEGSKGEKNNLPSQTQPDMSLSVKDLLRNHSRSSEVAMRKPQYFDTEIPQFDDITEAIEYKKDLEERAKELGQQIKDEKEVAKTKRLSDEKKKKAEDLEKAKKLLENEQEPPPQE